MTRTIALSGESVMGTNDEGTVDEGIVDEGTVAGKSALSPGARMKWRRL